MNQLIVGQMKEFSGSLPASELEHLWLNVCMHLFKLNEEENETPAISNYLHLFALHVTKKFSLNMLKTISLKIEKKTSIEEQSEGHALVHKTSESRLAD